MFQLKYPVEQTEPPRSPLQTLPTLYDLPSEFRELDEVSMQLVSLASRDLSYYNMDANHTPTFHSISFPSE